MIDKTGKRKVSTYNISQNDKEPSWDGHLYVYSKECSQSKKDLLGRIPVQVKGKEVSEFHNKYHSFTIEMCDIRNYLNDHGVIYIVVELKEPNIDGESEFRVFYKFLLPIELQKIIEDKGTQQTVNVKINKILKKRDDFFKECERFIKHRKCQGIDQVQKAVSIEKVKNNEIVLLDIDKDIDYFKDDIYLYAKGDYKQLIPIKDNVMVEEVVVYSGISICKNNKSFKVKEVSRRNGDKYSIFGDKIVIDYRNNKLQLEQSEGYIKDRLETLNIMISIIEDSKIGNNEKSIKICNIKKSIESINYIINTCIKFKIDIDKLRLKDLNENDWNSLSMLGIIEEKIQRRDGIENFNLMLIPFRKNNILTLQVNYAEDIKYIDFYSDKIDFELVAKHEKTILISRFVLLKKDSLLCLNFNKDTIINSIKRSIMDNDNIKLLINYYTNFSLELIKAWDESFNNEYLEIAEYIFTLINDYENSDILLINKAQIEKRLNNKLSSNTLIQLCQIISCDNTADDIKAAIYILLEDYKEFYKVFEKLDIERKNKFIKYPIYNLLKNSKDNLKGEL